jgi:hypothetical protein
LVRWLLVHWFSYRLIVCWADCCCRIRVPAVATAAVLAAVVMVAMEERVWDDGEEEFILMGRGLGF